MVRGRLATEALHQDHHMAVALALIHHVLNQLPKGSKGAPSGEAFGGERLRELLRGHGASAAPQLVDGGVASLKAFA